MPTVVTMICSGMCGLRRRSKLQNLSSVVWLIHGLSNHCQTLHDSSIEKLHVHIIHKLFSIHILLEPQCCTTSI